MTFFVLPDLAHYAVFSQQFLDQMDAFNTCADISDFKTTGMFSLCTLTDLGPVQKVISKVFKK